MRRRRRRRDYRREDAAAEHCVCVFPPVLLIFLSSLSVAERLGRCVGLVRKRGPASLGRDKRSSLLSGSPAAGLYRLCPPRSQFGVKLEKKCMGLENRGIRVSEILEKQESRFHTGEFDRSKRRKKRTKKCGWESGRVRRELRGRVGAIGGRPPFNPCMPVPAQARKGYSDQYSPRRPWHSSRVPRPRIKTQKLQAQELLQDAM